MKLSGEAIEEIRVIILSQTEAPEEDRKRGANHIIACIRNAVPPYWSVSVRMPIFFQNGKTGEVIKAGELNLVLDRESGYWNIKKEEKI